LLHLKQKIAHRPRVRFRGEAGEKKKNMCDKKSSRFTMVLTYCSAMGEKSQIEMELVSDACGWSESNLVCKASPDCAIK
jgi:hypothetical protein